MYKLILISLLLVTSSTTNGEGSSNIKLQGQVLSIGPDVDVEGIEFIWECISWNVQVDEVLSGSYTDFHRPCLVIVDLLAPLNGEEIGYIDNDIKVGDRVEVYGIRCITYSCDVSLVGNSRYYIKKISSSSQKPECSGTITGYVYDDATNDPIDDALVEWGRIYDDTNGRGKFTLDGDFCPDTRYTIECSADGYESDTKRLTTDDDGNGDVDFYLDPDCDGTISGYVRDTTTRAPIKGALVEVESSGTLHIYSVNRNSDETSRSGRFSIDSNFCPNTRYTIKCSAAGYKLATRSITTERDGDKEVDIYLEPERPVCSGTVSGHVYDASTRRPISGASLLFCHGGDCWAVPVTDSWGLYASIGRHCPSNIYEVTCSADGYRLETKRATTDSLGNAAIDFHLVPLCRGTISGRVYDSTTGRPIPGAALLFCQGGDCWCPPVTDSQGNYGSSDRFCPSSTCEITCSADGYKTETRTIATDTDGNYRDLNIPMEPEKVEMEVSVEATGGVTEVDIGEASVILVQAKPKGGFAGDLEGASVTLNADGGRFLDTGTTQITGGLTRAGAFGRKWEATASGTYTFTATISKPGYETGIATVNIIVRSDYRLVVEPDTTLQGAETELRVTANLPALKERGQEAVRMSDPVHWYIITPSGQEIEGEKDTFHESRAGGPSDVATYDFPEAGEYVVRVELPESGLERAWTVYARPLPEIDDGSNEAGSSESDSSWIYEMDRYQTYSKVEGEIVQVELINVTVINEDKIEAMLRVRNTRPARYNLETYDGRPLIDSYNKTLTLNEAECIIVPVRAIKRDDSYVAGLDVNVDFATYFLENLMGAVACTPSTETLMEIKETIKEESYPDKSMREISLESWALSTTEFFRDHPETLAKATIECGTDLAVGEILDKLPLVSQLMTIVDGLRMSFDGLTCPSEEIISIDFRRD